jgi:hypothetical protein
VQESGRADGAEKQNEKQDKNRRKRRREKQNAMGKSEPQGRCFGGAGLAQGAVLCRSLGSGQTLLCAPALRLRKQRIYV